MTPGAPREPGLSVRMRLTLSYAGFLVVAGVLLLAVVYVFLLRYVPDEVNTLGPYSPNRGDLERAFLPRALQALAALLVVGLLLFVQSEREFSSRLEQLHVVRRQFESGQLVACFPAATRVGEIPHKGERRLRPPGKQRGGIVRTVVQGIRRAQPHPGIGDFQHLAGSPVSFLPVRV